MADEAIQALQNAIGVCARAGMELFTELWEKLQEVMGELVEAGRPLAQVALTEIAGAMKVIEDNAKKIAADGADKACTIAAAGLEAAKENGKIAGALLLDGIQKAMDSDV